MADETEIFSSVILETLTTAEDQLANKEIDCERVRCAINDLKSLLVLVIKRRFSQRSKDLNTLWEHIIRCFKDRHYFG